MQEASPYKKGGNRPAVFDSPSGQFEKHGRVYKSMEGFLKHGSGC